MKTSHFLDFYQSRRGQATKTRLQQAAYSILENCFGFYVVQLGSLEKTENRRFWLPELRLQQKILCQDQAIPGFQPSLAAKPEQLPFATDSLDLVLCLHVLEWSQDPEAVLTEIRRSLTAHGWLLILAHNPYSFAGGYRSHILLPSRLKKIAQNLDFSFIDEKRFCVFQLEKTLQQGTLETFLRSTVISLSFGLYLLLLRKQVGGMTTLPLPWRQKQQVNNKVAVTSKVKI
jgi:SAM-dependent methyltransferase